METTRRINFEATNSNDRRKCTFCGSRVVKWEELDSHARKHDGIVGYAETGMIV